jgi:hypothetical protein
MSPMRTVCAIANAPPFPTKLAQHFGTPAGLQDVTGRKFAVDAAFASD